MRLYTIEVKENIIQGRNRAYDSLASITAHGDLVIPDGYPLNSKGARPPKHKLTLVSTFPKIQVDTGQYF